MVGDEYKPELEAAVGTSTKKDAREAGREVAKNTLSKMKSKPDFFLLFPTIHYESQGGFKEFLSGVWEILPEGTPLIGGTMAGFLNHQGVYARGATALAVSYPNMDVTIGYGKNTKRNPKKAARHCSKMLKKGLKNEYDNKVLLSFVSATKPPSVPGVKSATVISSRFLAKLMLPMLTFIQRVFQKGIGREEEVVEEITRELPDYNLIHGSSTMGSPYAKNYQFINNSFLKESVVVLGIESDSPINLNFATGAEKSDMTFKITKISKNKKIVKKINNKPAFTEFLRLMNWPKESIDSVNWTDTGVRYPIGFEKKGRIMPRPQLMIVGDYLGFLCKIEEKDAFILKMDYNKTFNAMDEVLINEKPKLGLFISCFSQRDLLGIKVFDVQEKLKQYFQGMPFLLVYTGGEAMYKPNEGLFYLNEAVVSAFFEGAE